MLVTAFATSILRAFCKVVCRSNAVCHLLQYLATMAGPNLEVFKFGLYLFFPLAIMIHYGDPDWYRNNVLPIRDQFWPDERRLFVRS